MILASLLILTLRFTPRSGFALGSLAEYCDKICGKFIHHNPDGVKARQQSSLSRTTLSRDESVLNAMNAYKDFFGEACQWDYKGFEAITTNCRDANRAFKQYDFFFKTTKITEMKRIFETYRLRQCPARDISTLISFGRSNNQGRGHSVDSEIEGSGKN